MGMAAGPPLDAALQAKAKEKCEFVQGFLRSLERALETDSQEDRQWLQKMLDPSDTCFRALIMLFLEPKYHSFVSLRCVAMRAVQLLLRIGAQYVGGPQHDPDIGASLLLHLTGDNLANQACEEVKHMALGSENNIACSAILLLSELGPEAFPPQLLQQLITQLLDLFVVLPERASDMVEVALRAHAWGGEWRRVLLANAVLHEGGQLLCEVLLQVINRADEQRRLRALKVLAGCLTRPNSERLLYTNDVRVLVEILLRELPNFATDSSAFECHAECFKALVTRCEAARTHRREKALQVLEDLRDDDRCEAAVRVKCSEVLTVLAPSGVAVAG